MGFAFLSAIFFLLKKQPVFNNYLNQKKVTMLKNNQKETQRQTVRHRETTRERHLPRQSPRAIQNQRGRTKGTLLQIVRSFRCRWRCVTELSLSLYLSLSFFLSLSLSLCFLSPSLFISLSLSLSLFLSFFSLSLGQKVDLTPNCKVVSSYSVFLFHQ